jgi:hypothetical protein
VELEEGDRVIHATGPEQSVPEQMHGFFLGRSGALMMERGTWGGLGGTRFRASRRDAGKNREAQAKRHDGRVMRRHHACVPHGWQATHWGAAGGGGAVGSVSENRQGAEFRGSPGLP